MRIREDWMFDGAEVMVMGRPGKILSMYTAKVRDVEFVYSVEVVMVGMKYGGQYSPYQISKIKAATA